MGRLLSLFLALFLRAQCGNAFLGPARARLTHKSFATTTPPVEPALTRSSSRWSSFDYLQHWYPVSWLVDLPVNKPTRVSLFDVHYAVAVKKDENGTLSVLALQDSCPHKRAALSEGRITKTGFLQCAYHGWSFDDTGKCVQIPQAASSASSYSTRSCAQSIPAKIHQDLVWLWPGPVPAQGIQALPTPPTLPEMDDPDFKYVPTVRDFPCIDWALLLSNILDPDHGMFAHQTAPFDMYTASPDMPLDIEESFDNAGWVLTTRVAAQEKLLKNDRQKRGQKTKTLPSNITATTTFHAPNHVVICRRNNVTNETKFVTAFWVCPTGTGRSRFMSAGVGKVPFTPPRWLSQILLNGFLDQDTPLVASQNPPVLTAEAAVLEEQKQAPRPGPARVGARAGLFVYQSPTDRSVRLIDKFWDETLSRAPNRAKTLLSLQKAGLLEDTPPREIVLDRQVQHLDICPDSQITVRNCRWIYRASLAFVASWSLGVIFNKVRSTSWWVPTLSLGVGLVAKWIQKQFYYVYTKKRRDKDLAKIPVKMWSDPV